jgi:hypothetical protein
VTEALLNKLLRRVDWRFLLPTPFLERTICFNSGVLADAVRLVSASTVEPDSDSALDCDLAVAVDPEQKCIEQAWARLRPGGSVYFEFYHRRWSRKATISRCLGRLGFENISFYRPWPSAEAAHYWVPLNSSAARRYLRATRTTGTTRCSRVRHLAAHLKWLANLRFMRTTPLCIIARKTPAISGERLEEMLQRALPKAGISGSRDSVSQMLVTGGRRSINKVVDMIFAEPRAEPILAAKMPRVSDSAIALAKEASHLESVHSFNGNVKGIPELFFKAEMRGTFTLGLSAFIGVPIFARLQRRTYRCFAIKATDWLIALAGKPRLWPRHLWWRRLVEPVLCEFDRCYGRVVGRQERQKAEQIIGGLPALPLVCEQRDFSPWNILLTPNGDLAVLDWESAEPQGLPALDLIYCLTYFAFFLDGAADEVSFLKSYHIGKDPRSFTGSINAACLQRYVKTLGLSTSYLRALRLLTWMLHSRSEHRRLVSDTGHEPMSEALDRGLFLNLWRQELASGTGAGTANELP